MLADRIRMAGGGLSLSFVGIKWSATTSWSYPTGTAIGDLVVLIDVAANTSGTPSAVNPSGWTQIGSHTMNAAYDARTLVHRRILASTTPPTGMAGDIKAKAAVVLRPSRTPASITSPTWDIDMEQGDVTSSSTGGGSVAGPLAAIGFVASNSGSADSFGTQSPTFANTGASGFGSGIRGIVGVTIYPATGTSHTVDISDLNDVNTTGGGYLTVA